MTNKETLCFIFSLEPQFLHKPPVMEIIYNHKQILAPCEIVEKQDIAIDIDIDLDNQLDGGLLEIKITNHDGANHQTLTLSKLKVDDIDMAKILDHSRFYPEYPEPWLSEQHALGIQWPEFHTGWLEWGWNGTWQFRFQVPFYDWLLKTL